MRRCLLYTQYRARGGIILLLTQVFHQPRNPMESGILIGLNTLYESNTRSYTLTKSLLWRMGNVLWTISTKGFLTLCRRNLMEAIIQRSGTTSRSRYRKSCGRVPGMAHQRQASSVNSALDV